MWSFLRAFKSTDPDALVRTLAIRRLPAMDLVQFKSVSKACYSIITYPQFLRDHLNYVSIAENEVRILIAYENKFHPIFYHEEDNAQKDCPVLPPLMVTPEFASCHSSCVGLLLFLAQSHAYFEENHIVICNPSTEELIETPVTRHIFHFVDCYGPPEDIFGLGYDPHPNDYKVLRFPSTFKAQNEIILNEKDGFNCLAEVYPLKTNSWKAIKDGGFMYLINSRSESATVNQHPH